MGAHLGRIGFVLLALLFAAAAMLGEPQGASATDDAEPAAGALGLPLSPERLSLTYFNAFGDHRDKPEREPNDNELGIAPGWRGVIDGPLAFERACDEAAAAGADGIMLSKPVGNPYLPEDLRREAEAQGKRPFTDVPGFVLVSMSDEKLEALRDAVARVRRRHGAGFRLAIFTGSKGYAPELAYGGTSALTARYGRPAYIGDDSDTGRVMESQLFETFGSMGFDLFFIDASASDPDKLVALARRQGALGRKVIGEAWPYEPRSSVLDGEALLSAPWVQVYRRIEQKHPRGDVEFDPEITEMWAWLIGPEWRRLDVNERVRVIRDYRARGMNIIAAPEDLRAEASAP